MTSSISPDGARAEIVENALVAGNPVKNSSKGIATASKLIYVDANSKLASGGLPFAAPLISGVTSTSASVLDVEGSATGSADELMHLTLVKGANATSTIAGFMRITVTDDAGVITNGAYYMPFYTLG